MASAGRILIMPKGEYNANATYEMLDLVKHNGTSWVAKKTSVGIEPSTANSEYWQDVFNTSAIDYAIDVLDQRLSNVESSLTQTRTDLDLRTNSRVFFRWDDGGALQVFIDGTYYGTVKFIDK